MLAGPTGLEPATSGVTGRRSNRLNYDPAIRNLANLTSGSSIPGEARILRVGWWGVKVGENLCQREVDAEGEQRDQPAEEDDEGCG